MDHWLIPSTGTRDLRDEYCGFSTAECCFSGKVCKRCLFSRRNANQLRGFVAIGLIIGRTSNG